MIFCFSENQHCKWWRTALLLPTFHLCRRHRKHSQSVWRLSWHHPANAPTSIWATVIFASSMAELLFPIVMHLLFFLAVCLVLHACLIGLGIVFGDGSKRVGMKWRFLKNRLRPPPCLANRHRVYTILFFICIRGLSQAEYTLPLHILKAQGAVTCNFLSWQG